MVQRRAPSLVHTASAWLYVMDSPCDTSVKHLSTAGTCESSKRTFVSTLHTCGWICCARAHVQALGTWTAHPSQVLTRAFRDNRRFFLGQIIRATDGWKGTVAWQALRSGCARGPGVNAVSAIGKKARPQGGNGHLVCAMSLERRLEWHSTDGRRAVHSCCL
jgi:hypothetical protein